MRCYLQRRPAGKVILSLSGLMAVRQPRFFWKQVSREGFRPLWTLLTRGAFRPSGLPDQSVFDPLDSLFAIIRCCSYDCSAHDYESRIPLSSQGNPCSRRSPEGDRKALWSPPQRRNPCKPQSAAFLPPRRIPLSLAREPRRSRRSPEGDRKALWSPPQRRNPYACPSSPRR